jgi:hypothetical protein
MRAPHLVGIDLGERMKRTRLALVAIVIALGLLAPACGRSSSDSESTTSSAATKCDNVTLESTEIGVTPEAITVETMADVGSALAPGLFQGNIDAMKGFAKWVNANGGLACRQLVVSEWDSKLSPDEAHNGIINACAKAVAMVGGNALFNPDTSVLSNCVDKAGQSVGLPDIAAAATDVNEQCNPNAVVIQAVAETCPITVGQPRPLQAFVGQIAYYKTLQPDLKGIFLVPGDLPTTVQVSTYQIAAQGKAGVTFTDALKVSGRDEQSAYTARVQALKSGSGNFVYDGSNDVAMIKMMKETKAQGYDGVKVWACSIACYTTAFAAGGASVEGTYLWVQFIPFEEADTNENLKAYLENVSDPVSFGANAWQAGLLFKQVIDQIVAKDGPNAITRSKILETLKATKTFDAGGWLGEKPLKGTSNCFVMLQVKNGKFERVFPRERGTMDCRPENLMTVTLDPAAEAAKIK